MTRHANKGQQGGALLSVMMITLTVSALLGTMVSASIQRSFVARKLAERVKAKSYAEAGAEYAYSMLMTNFSLRSEADEFPTELYQDGTYSVTVTPVGDDMAIVSSVGHCGGADVEVIFDIKDYTAHADEDEDDDPLPDGAWGCAIFSGERMTWSGSGTMDVSRPDGDPAKVHANADFRMTGTVGLKGNISSVAQLRSTGATEIDGDAAAPVFSGKSPANITGTASAGAVDPITCPQLDLTPYYNFALANGEVYEGDQHFTGPGAVMPNGGVMWVNGDLKISSSGNLIGCFVATGDIDISGSCSQVKVSSLPALISRDGNIDISGSGDFNGLIYAMSGDFEKSGVGLVTGSIIAAGDFTRTGGWSAIAYEPSVPPDDPADAPADADSSDILIVGIAAVQK